MITCIKTLRTRTWWFLALLSFLLVQVLAPVQAWHVGFAADSNTHVAIHHDHHDHAGHHDHSRTTADEAGGMDDHSSMLDHHHHAPATESNATVSPSFLVLPLASHLVLLPAFSVPPYCDPVLGQNIRPPIA